MRRIATTIATVCVGSTLTLLCPTAQADNESFVSATRALGFQQGAANLVSTAESACYFLSLNRDAGQVSDRISRFLAVDAGSARTFLVMSVDEYCPQYGGQVRG